MKFRHVVEFELGVPVIVSAVVLVGLLLSSARRVVDKAVQGGVKERLDRAQILPPNARGAVPGTYETMDERPMPIKSGVWQ